MHLLFAVLVVRRKTFGFSVVSRRGVCNYNNLTSSFKSNTKQKLVWKFIRKEKPYTYKSLAKFSVLTENNVVWFAEGKVDYFSFVC